MDESWDYFQYSLQAKTHCCAEQQELAILAFKKKKNFHTCPLKPT